MKSERLEKMVLIIATLFLIFFLILVSVDVLHPEEEDKIAGIVIVSKDSVGTITSVKLVVEDTLEYYCILNEKGKKLGETMDKKWVEVTGNFYKEADAYWLKVVGYHEVID